MEESFNFRQADQVSWTGPDGVGSSLSPDATRGGNLEVHIDGERLDLRGSNCLHRIGE